MVGLVFVSHSRQLAQAVCHLAKSVSQASLPLDFAGGTGENHEELGTDATDIMDAITRVYSDDGVLVLMDLGSAVLSARLAQQMLEDDCPKVRLCPAPLVEGGVAAAVQIGAGARLEDVYAEAKSALEAKFRELEEPAGDTAQAMGSDTETPPPDALLYRFYMDDPNGMHTRPAAEFVKAVSGFPASVLLRNAARNLPFAGGKSLNKISMSNIQQGDLVEVAIWGPEAQNTLESVKTLVRDVYHSREVAGVPAEKPQQQTGKKEEKTAGLVRLSPGVALGTLYTPEHSFSVLVPHTVPDVEAEAARLDAAVAEAQRIIAGQKALFSQDMRDEAAIIDAQLLMLSDAETLSEVKEKIRRDHTDAASTYQQKMLTVAEGLRSLDNEYMQQRAGDVDGVAEQVLYALAGKTPPDVSQLTDVIIWAHEVTPTFVSRWSQSQLKGILTEKGGASSHVAILAKALNIPAITGYALPEGAGTGTPVLLDADAGEVILNPSEAQLADFSQRYSVWKNSVAKDFADSQGEAVTLDGVHVPVLANVGDLETAKAAAQNGAEGIGLLRTEFLFMNRRAAPTEEEQLGLLSKIFQPFAALPITVRTLDIGGDKSTPWLDMPEENNPFLGVRGVRLYMRRPEVFKTQLRAILRAGHGYDIRLMIPMISVPEEVVFARNTLQNAHAELLEQGLAHCWPLRFGIMIETPAAMLQAEKLAAMVDFFSIGTNDLTQYVMSAERGSKDLASLSDGMHPAVLQAIGMVAEGAAKHATELAVCGEMAGDPVAAKALLGLGVEHLSMNAPAIGKVKNTIRRIAIKDMVVLAEKAKKEQTAADARRLFS